MLKQVSRFEQVYHQAPRKKIKLNLAEDQNYNQFKGDICQEDLPTTQNSREPREPEPKLFKDLEEENSRNKHIYSLIKEGSVKAKKIGGEEVKRNAAVIKEQVKKEQKPNKQKQSTVKEQFIEEVKGQAKKEKSTKKKAEVKAQVEPTGKNNWATFLKQNQKTEQKELKPKVKTQFVALDCEFVKSGDKELLARLSIVDKEGNILLDSYVRPKEKITDYLTDISGVTYTHIKNAPDQQTVVDKAKKVMYNKIVVGHTIAKDFEVCGLQHWKGCKALININEFVGFQQSNGKLISLRNLSLKFLGKNIQEGRHSSVQDANTTLQLFKLRQRQILKQFKVII